MGEIRRYRRFPGWDYAKGASLFVTIATEPRQVAFGRVVGGKVQLSPLGGKVKEAIEAMPQLNGGMRLYGSVVMPDHIHFNCSLQPGLEEPLKVLGWAIRRFKNYTTKMAKQSLTIRAGDGNPDGRTVFGLSRPDGLWQQGYHDYLLVSRAMIAATERYIAYNPLKWELMHGCDRRLRIIEPLCSPRLDIGDYWKGVGNIELLSPEKPMVSLRVSRRVRDIPAVVARMERAVEAGYTIISGFISPGERAVRDMLRRRADARFIRMLPSCIPNRRFKPESALVSPFAEERYLEIARGNDEREFGRAACLDLNDEIAEIAASGKGLALYFTDQGLKVIRRGEA